MNKKFEEFLFWFQLVIAWLFSVPQIIRMTQNQQGVTTALYVLYMVFLVTNATLAMRAYLSKRDRSRAQSVIIYLNWCALILAHLVVAVRYVPWKTNDNYFLILTTVATAMTLLVARCWKNLDYNDSIVRGIVACICKGGPQLYLATCIVLDHGGKGMAPITIWLGHVTVLTRIAQVFLSARKTGVDRNIKGILIAEFGNELTWAIVTIVWLTF